MVLKIIGVVFSIILAIMAIFALAILVFVGICLYDDQKRDNEMINNKTSE